MSPQPTITRLNDAAPVPFPWGQLQWLCNGQIDAGAETTFGICTIQPGQRNPRHYHPNCEEILYVLSGVCDHTFGDDTHRMTPGDMILIPQGVHHNAINAGDEPLVCVISFSSPDREAVFLEE